MASISFGPPDACPKPACGAPPGSVAVSKGNNRVEGAEARRVKNFTGQHTFQVPAADDFIKGMLPHGQLPATQASAVRQFCSVVGSMVSAIKSLWQVKKPSCPAARKPD